MSAHLPILTLLMPLFGALAIAMLFKAQQRLSYFIAVITALATTLCSCLTLALVLRAGTQRYALAGWPAPFGIELIADPLAAFISAVIGLISVWIFIYSGPSLTHEAPHQKRPFFALALILQMGLHGMVLTGDLFNLYVFLEIASLAAYALMAIGDDRAPLAALRYLLLGSVGASFYLLGLGFLYVLTGSLNRMDLSTLIAAQSFSPPMITALSLMVLGFALKMALFPFHSWLPDTYTYASSPSTALIAPLMTKVSAYVIIRLLYFLFDATNQTLPAQLATIITWLACAGIMVGSIMALAQRNMKRMLAYSSISQIAYIGLGIGLAHPIALIGAVLHVLNHALMKSVLFMASGAIALRRPGTDLDDLKGLGRSMPWTAAAIVIACLAMIGVPPTVGFFSKWYLALGALEQGQWIFVVVLLLSSLLTAVYLFRVIEHMYLLPGPDEIKAEAPWLMRLPLGVLSTGILIVGFFSSWLVQTVLVKVVPHG